VKALPFIQKLQTIVK